MRSATARLPVPAWAREPAEREFALIVAGDTLGAADLERIVAALTVHGLDCRGDGISDTQRTAEFAFTASGERAYRAFDSLYVELAHLDVFVVPQQERTRALLICDMDSTIIQTESLDELAGYMGIGDEIAAITARAMNGELQFREALEQRVALLSGLPYASVEDCVRQTRYNDGARELIAAARARGLRTVLVSGGFSPFVAHVADDLGFDHWVANRLEVNSGRLTGRVLEPVVDKDTKSEVLRRECQSLGIHSRYSCTIGDGANDIDMLVAAGLGVAFQAKPVVLNATPYHLRHSSLATVIRLLGLTNAAP